MPVPHVGPRLGVTKKTRKQGQTIIITSSPYKATLEAIAMSTEKKTEQQKKRNSKVLPKKTPAKTLFETVSNKSNLDETDSLESSDDGDISDMITEWRDDEQELMSLMDQDNYNEGDYVMVKFTRKQRVSYYAGEIKEIDTESEEAQTMFLRRGDLHKGFALTFYWPKEEDNIVLKLPTPTRHGGTSRTAQKLSFPCDLSQFDNQML